MKRLFVLILAALPLVCGAQDAPKVAFGGGEELYYTVSYRAKLIPNISVMRINLRTVDEDVAGRPHYHIVGNGKTSNFVKGFFNINDTYHSWLDAATMKPTRMTSDIQEDDYRFKATYTYDWNTMTVNTVRRNAKWDADKYVTFPLTGESGDAMSLFFSMRQIDVSKLTQGASYRLDLVLHESTKPIFYRFMGREQIKVRKAGSFNALKFTCTMATSDDTTYEEGMEFTMWISDDENKIPLMIDSPIRVGSVRVTLADGWKVMHPLTSLIK